MKRSILAGGCILWILCGCGTQPADSDRLATPVAGPEDRVTSDDSDKAHTDLSPAHEHPDPDALRNAPEWSQPLMPAFQYASETYDVPLDLLLTLGWIGSGLENRGDVATIEGGYGVMGLRENNLMGTSLALAAQILSTDRESLVRDPAMNILGAAAVLSSYAEATGVDRSGGIEAWLPAVVKYAGLDEEDSRFFARGVYERLQLGLDVMNSRGERFTVASQPLQQIRLEELIPPGVQQITPGTLKQLAFAQSLEAAATPDYPGATWDQAATCNWTASITTKDTIVVHTIEGTAAGARSWFKNCESEVSAHYVVSEAGGVWQMVEERYRAWHAGCYNTRAVGIEHEGYAGSASHPTSLYDASAALSADICNRRGIPKAKTTVGPGIIGHIDVTNCCCGTHWDPGPGWDWNYYIAKINNTNPVKFSNAVQNGGFEADLTSWAKGSTSIADILTTSPHGGAKYCKVHRPSAYATLYQDPHEITGQVWRATCWAYAAPGMTAAEFGYKNQSGVTKASLPLAVGSWQFYSVDWTIADDIDVQIWGTGDQGVFMDDVRSGRASRMNWIPNWLWNGTYAANISTDHLVPAGGEANVYPGSSIVHAGHTWTPVSRPDGFIDLDAATGGASNCVTYAHVYVLADAPKTGVNLVIGADDGIKVFLNGTPVHTNDADSGHDYFAPDEDIIPDLTLNRGENRLLIKVREASGAYSFSARFCDDNGDAITGLTYSLEPGARFVSNTLPTTMLTHATQSATVTMKNTGAVAWTPAQGYKLGAVGDSDPFAGTRVELAPGETIAPGASKTFTLSLTAPATAGTYTSDWRMVQEGIQWFGEPVARQIVVVAGVPGDMDADTDVDQSDFGAFQKCMTGSFLPQPDPACSRALIDGDTDVDQDDFDLFHRCFTGAGNPGSIACAG